MKIRHILALLSCAPFLLGSVCGCNAQTAVNGGPDASEQTVGTTSDEGSENQGEIETDGNENQGEIETDGNENQGDHNPGGNVNQGDHNPGGNENQGEKEPDGSVNQGDKENEESGGHGDPDVDEAERYGYLPQFWGDVPEIRVETEDGSNAFATQPNFDWKKQGLIEYCRATVTVCNCPAEMAFSAPAQVKVRGNYTLDYPKKPLRLKFDKKQSMLGLNGGQKYKSWVLLADWKDLSALNNATAFYLGNAILGSDGYYTSDFCTVEVYLNGEYWGAYLLAEQQEAKEGRGSAAEAEEGETGTDVGYLVEYDGYAPEERSMPDGDPVFELSYCGEVGTAGGGKYYPSQTGYTVKSGVQSQEQLDFLQQYFENVFRVLYAAAYDDRALCFNASHTALTESGCSPREAVEEAVNVDSLVDMYLLQEIVCDPDIAWSSFYFTLDMRESGAKKLTFEAPWDFDSAFGIKEPVQNGLGLYAAESQNPWLTVLVRLDWFQTLVREKWAELVKYGVLRTALSLIGEHEAHGGAAFARSLARWSDRLAGNSEVNWEIDRLRSQAEAADRLYAWLHVRLNELNGFFGDGTDVLTGETPRAVPQSPDPSLVPYRFEAEDCDYAYPMSAHDYYAGASGGAYLGGVSGNRRNVVTLTVTAGSETEAYLSVGLSKRSYAADFSDWFTLFVNGVRLYLPARRVEACGGEPEWGAWTKVDLLPICLKAGENTIVLNASGSEATNLDYFELYSATALTKGGRR